MAFEDTGQKRVSPPYAPYQSFKTFVGSFKAHQIIPNRIDRSLLKNTSGTIQNQVMSALKFFDLIDDAGRPTDALRGLVDAYGGDNWPVALGDILKSSYSDIFAIQLDRASSSEFNDKFRATYQAEGETFRKASTFFLKAAREAGIPLSPYLTSGSKPNGSGTGGGKRRARAKQKAQSMASDQADRENPPPPAPKHQGDMASQLLAKFPEFDPNWPPEIQFKWFEGYQKLLAMGKK